MIQIAAAAANENQIHSVPLQMPAPFRKAGKKRPISEHEAQVNAMVARMVKDLGGVVGEYKRTETSQREVEILRIGAELEEEQVRRVREVRAGRDQGAVDRALAVLRDEAEGTGNLLFPMREALAAYGTVGEVAGTLRTVFGTYRPTAVF